MINIEKYKTYAEKCIRDTAPPCSSRCYFDLDVRKFTDKLRRGRNDGACQIYRNAVLLPGIVSQLCDAPCGRGCVRKQRDGAIRLRELEQYCYGQCRKNPQRYNLAKKEQKVAVVGAGLSGLTCALRILSKGFFVTVFEKTKDLGGLALRKMDPEICKAEIAKEFGVYPKCEFVTEYEIHDVSKLREDFDAVYIATGSRGSDFGLLGENYYPETKATEIPGIFLGGRRSNDKENLMEAMVDGINVAEAIDVYFRIGSMTYPTGKVGSTEENQRYYDLHYDWENSGTYEAVFDPKKELERCFGCNCSECVNACELMQEDRRYPKKLCTDIITTLKPNMSVRQAVRAIAGCTYCGKCRDACPEGIDMGACLHMARDDFYETGSFAEGFHEYWMQDLEFTLSKEAYLVWTKEPDQKSKAVFFPGCQLGASAPAYVKSAYAFVQKTAENPTLYLGCCGIPADWAGNEERQKEIAQSIQKEWKRLECPPFIVACTACQVNLKKFCPDIPTISLYEWMAGHADALPKAEEQPESKGKVFDPCGSAGNEEVKEAVRILAARYGYEPEPDSRGYACCGFGGHIYPSNQKLFDSIAQDKIDQSKGEMLVYCANCRDVFASRGKECRHILDLVFRLADSDRRPPSLSQRRSNRRQLKAYYTGEEIMEYEPQIPIMISEEIQKKMDRLLVLKEEVYETVETAEANGKKLYDREKNQFYAHKQIGNVTVWVIYTIDHQAVTVVDVYRHRVQIKEN